MKEAVMEEATLADVRGAGTAEYRNQSLTPWEPRSQGAKLIFGTFVGDGVRLRELAEARQPVRFEGVAKDHARRYKTVVMVLISYFDGHSLVNFRATGEPEEYRLMG